MGSSMFHTPIEKAAFQVRQTVHPWALQGSGWGGFLFPEPNMENKNVCEEHVSPLKITKKYINNDKGQEFFSLHVGWGKIPDKKIGT